MQNQRKMQAGGLQNQAPGVPKSRSGGLPEECGYHFWCLERLDALWGLSCDEKVTNMAPAWLPRWMPDLQKSVKKPMQKSIKIFVHLKMAF